MMTSNVVSLEVGITYDDAIDGDTSLSSLKIFSSDAESSSISSQSWSVGWVKVPQVGNLPMRLVFVASKALATAESQVVALDNLTVTTSCPSK